MGVEVTNNLEVAPEITGQGEETGEVTETEQPEIQAQQEVETEEEEGKGIPDDPKLLRAKMTQTTQKLSEAEKRLAEAEEYKAKVERLLSNPKIRQALEEQKGSEVSQPGLKFAEMTDEQKTAYKTLKPFMSLMLEEMGITPKLAQFENFAMTSAQRDAQQQQDRMINDFYSKHPEARDNPEVNKAVADIINNSLKNGEILSPESAWKIYVSDSAEVKAKQKVLEENKLKKEATLPKPNSASPAQIQTGKMSRRQAIEEALKTVGY